MRVMLFFLFVMGFACTRSVPVWDYSFSVLELSGTASSSSFDLPIQGAVTKRGEEIKFALTILQGLVLGYGRLLPEQRKVEVLFARESSSRQLVRKVGELALAYLSRGNQSVWIEIEGGARYKSKGLSLTLRRR